MTRNRLWFTKIWKKCSEPWLRVIPDPSRGQIIPTFHPFSIDHGRAVSPGNQRESGAAERWL
jgi:hypothetical protein